MNPRAQLVRRLAHDFIHRCRMALSNSGDDAARHVDCLTPEVVENVACDVCATIGIDYEGPPDIPRRKSDGRAAPWAGKGQAKSHKGG